MRLAEGEESCLLIRIHPAMLGPLGSRRGRVEQLRSKSVDRHHARALVDNTHPHHTGFRRQNAPKEAWAKRAAQLTLIHMVNRTMSPPCHLHPGRAAALGMRNRGNACGGTSNRFRNQRTTNR